MPRGTLVAVANRYFGGFADVWKHLVVNEVLTDVQPERYVETHAGSAAYPMVDDAERRYGVLGFLEFLTGATSSLLSATPFAQLVTEYGHRQPALYPGSALQAMTRLADESAYLLCDLDPDSVRDLRSWAQRLGLTRCEAVERDGLAAVRDWLPDQRSAVIHIDPFHPWAHDDGVPSAIELAAEVADSGHALVYWYGYDSPGERAWALPEIRRRTRTGTALWCGDAMVTAADGSVHEDGSLGRATTAGTGCGVVLANVSSALIHRCEQVAAALTEVYAGRPLPDGESGQLNWSLSSTR